MWIFIISILIIILWLWGVYGKNIIKNKYKDQMREILKNNLQINSMMNGIEIKIEGYKIALLNTSTSERMKIKGVIFDEQIKLEALKELLDELQPQNKRK